MTFCQRLFHQRLARAAQHALSSLKSNWPQGWQGHDLHKSQTHLGLIISGDRFVSSHAESEALRAALPDALGVEMEGAAVAQVCRDLHLPFALLRYVSDRADDDAHVDFVRFMDEVASVWTRQLLDVYLQLPA